MSNPIDSERKRKVLKRRPRPYKHKIKPRHYIGYRRNQTLRAGKWIAILDKQQHALGTETEMTYNEALDAALLWFAANGGDGEVIVVNATVDTAICDYIAELEVKRTKETAHMTDARIRKHISPALLKTKLATLTTRQLKAFRNGMVKKSDDPETVRKSKDSANRVMSMLKAALNLSYRDGQVASDATWKRVESFAKVTKARPLFLTDDQVRELLAVTTGDLHDLIELAVHTGARYGELTAATVADFDANDGTLLLSGKTGSRTAYLSDGAVAVVKRLCRDKLPAALLLMRDDGDPWKKNSHTRAMQAAVRRAKLPAETVFYSLRHYHISKALLAGVAAQVVAENTGTSIRMLETHYAKFMKADRRAMFNRVELAGVK